MGLTDDVGAGPVAIDTVALIYLVERNRTHVDKLRPIFAAADAGELLLVTSALSLLEVLVVPYRAGDLALVERYEGLLTRSRGLHVVEIDRQQLRTAANLRARFRLRTPDALQVGAALSAGCTAFVTNDRDLPSIPDLPVLQLRDY